MNSQKPVYMDAISAYNKALQNFPSRNNIEQVENFSNSFNSFLSGVNNNAPAISGPNGVFKWLGEHLDLTKDRLNKGVKVTKKTLMKESSLTDMVTSLSDAEIALQTVINIRDKVISAYQDIIKMQI